MPVRTRTIARSAVALAAWLCVCSSMALSQAAPPRPPAGSPLSGGGAVSGRSGRSGADLVLRNGAVFTMDATRSWADAVAVKGGKIVYVGPSAGTDALIVPRTKVIDLQGRMVLPSFQDAHIHPISGGISYNACALFDLGTREAYVRKVKEYAAQHPDRPWIRGDG
ncbi:MAG: amidohydrolase family protein, partial [Candidatus Polarisedimenticolia bacterium]